MDGSQTAHILADVPGLQGACDDVQTRLAQLLVEGYDRVAVKEIAASVEFSRALVTVGSRPQRDALIRITALSLLLLSKMDRATAVPLPSARSAFRLQAGASQMGLDGVDLDGNPVEPLDD